MISFSSMSGLPRCIVTLVKLLVRVFLRRRICPRSLTASITNPITNLWIRFVVDPGRETEQPPGVPIPCFV
jgi:hypothetical protein